MPRSHILARELRGAMVVVLVAILITWLFAKLNDDRAEAHAERALANTTTSTTESTTTTTTPPVDDNERLCSLAGSFRDDLTALPVQLVSPGGAPVSSRADRVIDVGLHPEGDIAGAAREVRAAEDAETTTEAAAVPAVPPPNIVDTDRIDPVASGLLGAPQELALSFYSAASALRLGLIDADFDAAAEYFTDFVSIGQPVGWDLVALAESDFSDRWTALATQPVVGVDATLAYIEESCGIRIGTGFVYREEPPDLPVLDQVFVDGAIDPSNLPDPPPEDSDDG